MVMLGPLSPHLRKNPVRRRGLIEEIVSPGTPFGPPLGLLRVRDLQHPDI